LASGEDEMEYVLLRRGGRRERNVPKGRGRSAAGKRWRRARRGVRLREISEVKSVEERARRAVLVAAEVLHSDRARMDCRRLGVSIGYR
jgi:hypothetical protein